MTSTAEYTIEALRQALRTAENNAASATNEPFRPWRDDDGERHDNVQAAKDAVRAIQDQIIDLEISMQDAEQIAEMRMELQAEMALTGVHDDVSLYFHTPMQEEMFQAGIQRQVELEWMDEHGGPFKGSCEFCGAVLWDDEVQWMDGNGGCETCLPDILGLFLVLCLIAPWNYVSGDEWEWCVKVGESDVDDE